MRSSKENHFWVMFSTEFFGFCSGSREVFFSIIFFFDPLGVFANFLFFCLILWMMKLMGVLRVYMREFNLFSGFYWLEGFPVPFFGIYTNFDLFSISFKFTFDQFPKFLKFREVFMIFVQFRYVSLKIIKFQRKL